MPPQPHDTFWLQLNSASLPHSPELPERYAAGASGVCLRGGVFVCLQRSAACRCITPPPPPPALQEPRPCPNNARYCLRNLWKRGIGFAFLVVCEDRVFPVIGGWGMVFQGCG